ncbi:MULTISPECIES: hypothetical protein [Thalassospira]|uniref:hypothetical protein n=1 Tax=Thalassospira TaxID=168934 RepID=UPI0008DD9CCF|nr:MULTISPECIES: hypothetical protein [Thalassospira]MDM7975415.1 hypothetical protein [Thalassospira xiamenensis]
MLKTGSNQGVSALHRQLLDKITEIEAIAKDCRDQASTTDRTDLFDLYASVGVSAHLYERRLSKYLNSVSPG